MAGEREPGQDGRQDERGGLRPHHGATGVEPVDEHAGEEAEDRERQELAQGQHADRDG